METAVKVAAVTAAAMTSASTTTAVSRCIRHGNPQGNSRHTGQEKM
jgi:hypothetical protein